MINPAEFKTGNYIILSSDASIPFQVVETTLFSALLSDYRKSPDCGLNLNQYHFGSHF